MVEETDTQNMPLNGIKVIDLANFLAGPLSSMFLADFGAEVIKVARSAVEYH